MRSVDEERKERVLPRVVVVGLASCFGCQLQITNAEAYLTDVLGQIDLRYWQLASSDPMPEEFDVAVIEGAVTTEESEACVREVRDRAGRVRGHGRHSRYCRAQLLRASEPGVQGRAGGVWFHGGAAPGFGRGGRGLHRAVLPG